jgi:hypothetical protein
MYTISTHGNQQAFWPFSGIAQRGFAVLVQHIELMLAFVANCGVASAFATMGWRNRCRYLSSMGVQKVLHMGPNWVAVAGWKL